MLGGPSPQMRAMNCINIITKEKKLKAPFRGSPQGVEVASNRMQLPVESASQQPLLSEIKDKKKKKLTVIKKANVLPLPVLAAPRISIPWRLNAKDSLWISVGFK